MFDELNASPRKFLTGRAIAVAKARKELIVLALIKLATADPTTRARQLESKWGPSCPPKSATGSGA